MEIALLIALAAIGIAILSAFWDAIATLFQRKILHELQESIAMWKDKGDIGEQIGEWLLETEGEGKPTNLEILSQHVGSNLYLSMRNAGAAAMSGDSRHNKMVEGRVVDALEEGQPELKVLRSFAEQIGLDVSDVPAIIQVLQKYNMIPQDLGRKGNNGSQTSW